MADGAATGMDAAINERIARLDWERIRAALDDRGFATAGPLLTREECEGLAGLYEMRERFRSRVEMVRFRFGIGEYKYFANPLPPIVEQLRTALYPQVAPIANEWMRALRIEAKFPPALEGFL